MFSLLVLILISPDIPLSCKVVKGNFKNCLLRSGLPILAEEIITLGSLTALRTPELGTFPVTVTELLELIVISPAFPELKVEELISAPDSTDKLLVLINKFPALPKL